MPLVSATRGDDLWRWQVGNRGHPFGGIGSIRTRTAHGCVLLVRMLGPALYDKCPTGAIPKPGKDAMVSKNISTPRHPTWLPYYRSTAFPTQIFRKLLDLRSTSASLRRLAFLRQ